MIKITGTNFSNELFKANDNDDKEYGGWIVLINLRIVWCH